MKLNKEEIFQKVARNEMTVEEAFQYLEGMKLQAPSIPGYASDLDTFPLSEGQKALWVIYQLAPGNYAYNCPSAFKTKGLERDTLKKSLQYLLDRHPAFRTVIRMDRTGPVQKVLTDQPLCFEEVGGSGYSEAGLWALLWESAKKPFDLSQGPLFRVQLFTLPKDEQILLINIHHIVFDGVSLSIFLKELPEAYQAAQKGELPPWPAPEATYREFVQWQTGFLSSKAGKLSRDFWLQQLSGEIPALDLPLDKPRPAVQSYQGSSYHAVMDEQLMGELRQLVYNGNKSLFETMLAAFFVLLHHYSHQEDIIIGTPVMGRPEARFENIIGYFINMALIRGNLGGDICFDNLLDQIHHTFLEVMGHSDYPLYTLTQELRRMQNVAQLFQVAVYFQNWAGELYKEAGGSGGGNLDSLVFQPLTNIRQEGEFDLTLEIVEGKNDGSLYFKYNPDIFNEATIGRMSQHYLQIIREVVADPKRKLAMISLLTAAERRQILEQWNDTGAEYPVKQCVFDLFEAQAAKNPEAIAALYEGNSITYGRLNAAAAKLALYLNQNGVRPGSLVGIFMERSLEMLVGLLGVLKAGGAYIPLDPAYPADRLSYMFEDSQLSVLLTQSEVESRLPESSARRIRLDRDWERTLPEVPADGQRSRTLPRVKPEDLAYLIYTSGSTGKPKGVKVVHRGLTNFLCSMAQCPGFTQPDRILAVTTICFDIAGLELFLPLITGGQVDILPTRMIKDGIKLREKLEGSPITVMQATPATWRMLIAAGWERKPGLRILCGGEALDRELASKLLERGAEVWNLFGPTETTIWSSLSRVQPGEKITIGKPIANTQFYILDRHLNPVPVGVAGELYIGGDGLAQGYLNRETDNREKFIPDPFWPGNRQGMKEALIYKTGDLARFLPDGNVEYLCRADHQVKIRGFRVELGEIELALQKFHPVQEAVVVIREDTSGHKQLTAFYIAKQKGTAPSKAEFGEALKQWLPDYMIPASFIALESYPMTLNRKIDRKILMSKGIPEIVAKYGSPHGPGAPVEEAPGEKTVPKPEKPPTHEASRESRLLKYVKEDLAGLVAKITGQNRDTIDSETHMGEYGFDSIRFTTLSVELKQQYQLDVSPALFFTYSTVGSLAGYLVENFGPLLGRFYPQAGAPQSLGTGGASSLLFHPGEGLDPGPQAAIRVKPGEPIAIIGMSGRFSQSPTLEDFWQNLEQERDLVTEIPKERWDWRDFYGDPTRESNKTNSKWGSFIENVDRFDASFFGISGREAELMDPQQRLLLETVWETIENAGYRPSDFSGTRTGIFIGVTGSDYLDLLKESFQNIEPHTMTGGARTIIPNRISYFLNLHGPSSVLDTACSSSLVSVHHAVNAILQGECETAIAGGVNLLLSPIPYIAISKTGMMSDDGRCKTFDRSANGYVRGEGVATLLLKPLPKAEADGDHIYALIRSTAENHGGRTNSLTAPNPNAQAELLIEAYEKAGIDPGAVGYIEAHGTGTSLGDPIEVNGLKKAFQELAKGRCHSGPEQAHCGIGSVKSNIGHLEAAAGIAGMIKAILALQHQKIPGNIHLKEMNPYIDLSGSPFYIPERTHEWKCSAGDEQAGLPRRAGVSSFGFGGVNAHVVLEEYQAPQSPPAAEPELRLFVFSAKNEERLQEYLLRFKDFLAKNSEELGGRLRDLAYTLQAGREAMEERVAILAGDIRELVDSLAAAANGSGTPGKVYRGDPSKSKGRTDNLIEGAEGEAFIEIIIQNRNLLKLAQLWVSGANIDWKRLYSNDYPRRMALPTYPFEKTRYWIEEAKPQVDMGISPASKLHPLIDSNESTLAEQCYQKLFTGAEFYLRDHVVAGNMILPGVVYLEMARAAGELAQKTARPQRLTNIIWIKPVLVSQEPRKVFISLVPHPDRLAYEVHSREGEGQRLIHAQGNLIYERDPAAQSQLIDIEAVKSRCPLQISGADCYQIFRQAGFQYGNSFQVMAELYGGATEALARLETPAERKPGFKDFVLHPVLLDGALQTVIGLMMSNGPDGAGFLPFGMGELQILNPLPESCWIYVRLAGNGALTGAGLQKFNIFMVAPDGEVAIQITDYSIKTIPSLPAAVPPPPDPPEDPNGLLNETRRQVIQDLLTRLENGELDVAEVNKLMEVI